MSPSVLTNPYMHLGNTKIIDTLYIDSPLSGLPTNIYVDLTIKQIINLFSSEKPIMPLELLRMKDSCISQHCKPRSYCTRFYSSKQLLL